jgi:hypothetical protein
MESLTYLVHWIGIHIEGESSYNKYWMDGVDHYSSVQTKLGLLSW